MPKFFEEILKKPESYRRNVAWVATFVLGVVIVSIWLTIESYSMRKVLESSSKDETNTTEQFKRSLPSLNDEEVKSELMKEKEIELQNQYLSQ